MKKIEVESYQNYRGELRVGVVVAPHGARAVVLSRAEAEALRAALTALLSEADEAPPRLTLAERSDVEELPSRQPGCPDATCLACKANTRREQALAKALLRLDYLEGVLPDETIPDTERSS